MENEQSSAQLPFTAPGQVKPVIGSRELFPQLQPSVYLAHAAISPASSCVEQVCRDCVESVARLGVASFPLWNAQRERLRSSIAELLNVPECDLALTAGCTHGINDLALALLWKEGDRLLTFRGEFPANVIPWQVAARSKGADVVLLPLPSPTNPDCGEKILTTLSEGFELAGKQGHRVPWVAVSAVQFQTGLRMPLKQMAAICHEKGARLLVDGIQACGVIPLDLKDLGVDAFFSGAHKWLLGLEGVGFSYIKKDLREELQPLTAGWLSYQGGADFLFQGSGHLRYDRSFHSDARVFEGSTVNSIGFAALEVGIEVSKLLSPLAIYQHAQNYHDAVESVFVERGLLSLRAAEGELRSCILSFEAPDGVSVPALFTELKSRGVMVSTPDGLIRLAPHFSNSLEEVSTIAKALEGALQVC